jgi:hypothetical protein
MLLREVCLRRLPQLPDHLRGGGLVPAPRSARVPGQEAGQSVSAADRQAVQFVQQHGHWPSPGVRRADLRHPCDELGGAVVVGITSLPAGVTLCPWLVIAAVETDRRDSVGRRCYRRERLPSPRAHQPRPQEQAALFVADSRVARRGERDRRRALRGLPAYAMWLGCAGRKLGNAKCAAHKGGSL